MKYNVVLNQRLVCRYNNTAIVVNKVVSLPAPPYYGLMIESNLPDSMISQIAFDPKTCQIVYSTTHDVYRVHFQDLAISTEDEMLDHVERYRFHGWKVELEGASTVLIDEKSGYAKKSKKHPFTVIDGGKKEED